MTHESAITVPRTIRRLLRICLLFLVPCLCSLCMLSGCYEASTGATETDVESARQTGDADMDVTDENPTEEEQPTMCTETERQTIPLPDVTDTETAAESAIETATETETETETETDTEPPTEPETDPVREPLALSVTVDPYVPGQPAVVENVKAMWLSQFDLTAVYQSDDKIGQRNEEQYRTLIQQVLQNVADNGFNTVIVQVRPNADSMYPSDYYPPSTYVVGSYAGAFIYDPFEILIQEARYLGLSVHAWINPLRGMTTKEIELIDSSYLIRQWYDDDSLRGKYLVEVGSRLYLNPAYAEVRDLIVHGAREILERYDVDGVHMDDYFYPTTDASFDSAAYAVYQEEGGEMLLGDWRRENLSALVSALYKIVKKQDPEALFGISPSGVLNTVYYNQYADVYRWCREPGFVDYILPQIYFGFEHATAAFDMLSDKWNDVVHSDYVTLLIGMTFGKALAKYDKYAGSGAYEWAQHTDILARCVEYTQGLEKCRGVSIFCYQYFYHPVTGVPVSETKEERDNFTVALDKAAWGED